MILERTDYSTYRQTFMAKDGDEWVQAPEDDGRKQT